MPGFVDFSLQTFKFISSSVLFAGLVHGAFGLGFPLIATPLLALQDDTHPTSAHRSNKSGYTSLL